MNSFKRIALITFLLLGSYNINAQASYWIGGSGNWTDTSHWSNASGVPGSVSVPTPGTVVIFDGNSFTAPGQTVTVDTNYVNIYGMYWNLDSTAISGVSATNFYQPSFVSSSGTDTMIIAGSMVLHDSMTLYGFMGPLVMNGGLNDSIVSSGHPHLNDIILDTYGDTLTIKDDMATAGVLVYRRGGLFMDNRTITCNAFDSHKSGARALRANNAVFNLTGQDTVLYIKEMDSIIGTGITVNVLNSATNNTIGIGLGSIRDDWGTLNLANKATRFFSDSYFGIIPASPSTERIEIGAGDTLKCNTFGIDGDCGKYVRFIGDGGGDASVIDNGTTDWNLDFFHLENLICSPTTNITATNTIDLGGNANFTITEDNSVSQNFFWVGGQGNFYSDQHWSFTTGGAVSGCIPTPNDYVFFDANSFALSGDTLFLQERVQIESWDFTGSNDFFTVAGISDTIEVRDELTGSSFVQWDWDGAIKMTSNALSSLFSNGGQWNSDFVKTGTGSLILVDDFINLQDIKHRNGGLLAGGDITLSSFYSDDTTNTRTIDFTAATINISSSFLVDSVKFTYTNMGSRLNFSGSESSSFRPGVFDYDTVFIDNTTTLNVLGDSVNYNGLLHIGPGSTIILDNTSRHEFFDLYAVGTCDSLVIIRSASTTSFTARLEHLATWSSNLNVDYSIIDHVRTGRGAPYLANNSTISDSSLTWLPSAAIISDTIRFSIVAPDDTLSQGEFASILGTPGISIPPGAVVVSSNLTLEGVNSDGAADESTCEVGLSGGMTFLPSAPLGVTPGPMSNETFTIPLGPIATLPGSFFLDLLNVTGSASNYMVDTAYIIVDYYVPFVAPSNTYFWYGDAGDWSDINHWSLNSGNTPPAAPTCLPSKADHVVFDDASFSADNFTVTVDREAYFRSMTWQTIDDSATLLMNANLTASEHVTWDDKLRITKGTDPVKFAFQPRNGGANLDADSAYVDVALEVISTDLNDTLSLIADLDILDQNPLTIFGGVVNTNNFNIHANSMIVTSTLTPVELYLGSSKITLVNGFSDYGGPTTTLFAGTSSINIDYGGLVNSNSFLGNGHIFYDVELNFNSNAYSPVSGDNTFNSLKIGEGSRLRIEAGSASVVTNLFKIDGNCRDSIFMRSTVAATSYSFSKPADSLESSGLSVQDCAMINTGTATFSTFYSNNVGGNSGWTFGAGSSTTAAFGTGLNSTANFCFGDTVQTFDASTNLLGNSAGLTTHWSFGDGTDSTLLISGATMSHYYGFPGTYNLQLVSEYTNYCTDTIIDTIQIYAPAVSLYSSLGTLMCFEDSVILSANSVTGPTVNTSYTFYIDGINVQGPIVDGDTLITSNLSDSSLVNVIITENGCTVTSDTILLEVLPVPTVTITVPSTTICIGDSVNLSASMSGGAIGDYQYYLNGTPITPFMFTPFSSTTIANGDILYAVGRDTSSLGLCADTSNILTFTVNNLPIITSYTDSDPNNVICIGDTVTFTGAGTVALNYLYYLNGSLISNSTTPILDIDTLAHGDQVSLIIQDANSCYSDPSATFTYIVNQLPPVTLSSTEPSLVICSGTSVLFTAGSASQYQFFVNGNAATPLGGSQFYTTDSLNTGDIITVNGVSSGCVGSPDSMLFIVNPLPTITLSSDIGDTICAGELITLTATGAASNYEFFSDGSSVANGATNVFTYPAVVNGTVLSVVSTASSCSYTETMSIIVNNNPNATLLSDDGDNIICENGQIIFTGIGGDQYDYFVNASSAFVGTGTYTTTSLPIGSNTVSVVVTDTNTTCSSTSTNMIVNVTELPLTNLSTGTSTICAGEMVNITATSSVATDYQFFVNSQSQGLPSVINTYSSAALANGDTVVVVGYNNGCPNTGIDTVFMTVNPVPVASLTGTTLFCEGLNEIYTGTSSIAGSTFGFAIDGNPALPGATYNASALLAGSHVVTVIVTSPGGCIDSTTINVTILDNPIVSISGSGTICSGELATFIGSGASTYQYYLNGAPISAGAVYSSSALNNGDIVSLVGTSGASCVSVNSAQVIMNVTTTPTVTFVSDDADSILCTGQLVTFTASGATNYEFFINGFSQGAPSPTTTFATTALTNGQVVTVQGETNGCIDFTTGGIPFSVGNSPIVNMYNAGADTVLCVGENTLLVATGAASYQFFINGVPTTPTAVFGNDTLATTLNNGDIVTVIGETNTCATSAPESFQFSVFAYPTTTLLSSDADNIICAGEEVTFTGAGATDYEFFIDGLSLGTGGPVLVTNQIQNGETVSLIGYNAQCPLTAPLSYTFVVNTLNLSTILSPSNFMVCEGESLTLDASGADEYEIFVNSASQGAQSPVSNFVLSGLNDGDTITLNGFSTTTGCTQADDQTIVVQVFEAPAITVITDNIICEGDSTILVSNSFYGNQWYMDGSPIAGATDTSYTVFSSGDYTLGITNGGFGEYWSVGYNANGEFGDNTNFNSNLPSQAETVTAVAKITSGFNHTFALDASGDLFVSGDNSSGQLGNGTFTASSTPIQVTGMPAIADVAAGLNSSIAATTTGQLFVWGQNNDGQFGLGNTTVYVTPEWNVAVTGIVTNVASGRSHFVILKNDGTVWSSGNNDFGQLGIGSLVTVDLFTQVAGLTNIVSITAGDYHTIAIDNVGNMYVWGDNSMGQLGLNDLTNRTIPTLSPLDNVSAASGGNAHSVFVTNDERAYTSGANAFGQLGTGDYVNRLSPTHLSDIDAVTDITAGGYHSLFRKNDGTVWGVGRNDNYQLGDLVPASVPILNRIPNVEGVTYIDGGNESSHFVYGNNTQCTSASEIITVQSAPQPVILSAGGIFSTTASGASYEWFIDNIPIIGSNSSTLIPSGSGNYTVAVTYANGCTSVSDPVPHSMVGINEYLTEGVSLYPNPTNGEATIDWDESRSIESIVILDVLGKQIETHTPLTGTSTFRVDLTKYAKGIYTIQLTSSYGLNQVLRVVRK